MAAPSALGDTLEISNGTWIVMAVTTHCAEVSVGSMQELDWSIRNNGAG